MHTREYDKNDLRIHHNSDWSGDAVLSWEKDGWIVQKLELPGWVIQEIEKMTGARIKLRREPTQKGDMRDTYADTSQAKKDLDYQPSVTLRKGLEAEWNWLRSVVKGG